MQNIDQINSIFNGSQSLWMGVRPPSFPALDSNMNTDVCIVGAGIVGLTCAYTLAKQGKSVIVVDQDPIGSGQTARTTAHLTWALDDNGCGHVLNGPAISPLSPCIVQKGDEA